MTILGSLPVPGVGPLLVRGALASSLTAGDAASGARALTKILGSPQAADAAEPISRRACARAAS
jgi:hypothetical protein